MPLPRPSRFLLPALLALALSGCVRPPAPADTSSHTAAPAAWEPVPCDDSGVRLKGNNAPLVEGLRGTPAEVASRIVLAVGDSLAPGDPMPMGVGILVFAAGNGTLILTHHEQAFLLAEYRRTAGSGLDVGSLDRLLDSLGVDANEVEWVQDDLQDIVTARQGWGGLPVLWAPGGVVGANLLPREPARLVIGPLYDFQSQEPSVAAAAALERAKVLDRCMMDAEGATEAAGFVRTAEAVQGVAVLHDSVAWVASVGYLDPADPCGRTNWVFVDAMTGVLLGQLNVPCGEPDFPLYETA